MFAVFLAVTKDLWQFALQTVGIRKGDTEAPHTPQTTSSWEYIIFRLTLAGFTIPDGVYHQEQPLHTVLRGLPGVRINITPRTEAIMEVFDTTHRTQLLFVEEVGQNDTLTVSSVGWHTDGEFRIDTVSKSEWQEWRPVFINFETI